MLSRADRLHHSADFSDVIRRGRRASRPLLTVHALTVVPHGYPAGSPVGAEPGGPKAGLVVSRTVGDSVVRHRTARRLRHLLRDRMATLPPGARIVVRAVAGAGQAPSRALAVDLDGALAAALRPRRPR